MTYVPNKWITYILTVSKSDTHDVNPDTKRVVKKNQKEEVKLHQLPNKAN